MLITLTIIGVIAALTIPTLMKNYEKRQIEVGLAKTYQELSNVMKRSEVDNGEMSEWTFDNNLVTQYIAPYIELLPNPNRFKGPQWGLWKIQPNKNEESAGQYTSQLNFIYKLNDGRTIGIFPRNRQAIEFMVDVNGDRGHSVLGEDVFLFSYVDYYYYKRYKGLYAGNYANGGMVGPWYSRESAINSCKNRGLECSTLLMLNNWKFPDDYPLKF